jgi:hypothetical protein
VDCRAEGDKGLAEGDGGWAAAWAAERRECVDSRLVSRFAAGDIGGVEEAVGRSLENRLDMVLTDMPALFKALMRSAILPPEVTLGPSSPSSGSLVSWLLFRSQRTSRLEGVGNTH